MGNRINSLERRLEQEKIRRDLEMIAQWEVDEAIHKRVFRNVFGHNDRFDEYLEHCDRLYWDE